MQGSGSIGQQAARLGGRRGTSGAKLLSLPVAPIDEDPFLVAVPPVVRAAADAAIAADSPLRLSMVSDLRLDGAFGPTWLLLDDSTLAVVRQDPVRAPESESAARQSAASPASAEFTAELLVSHAVADIRDVQLAAGVGAGSVELRLVDRWTPLLRFSNTRRKEFAAAAGLIRAWAVEQKWEPEKIELRRQVCKSCGRPLPENMTTCPRCLDKKKQLFKVLAYLQPYRWQVAQMLIVMLVGSLFGLLTPYLGKILVDDVIGPRKNPGWLVPLVLGMVGLYIVQNIVDGWNGIVSARIGSSAVHDIRAALFHKLQDLSLNFYARHKVGALIARVNQDTSQLQRLLVDFIPFTINSVVTALGILALLFSLSWFLTLIVMVPVVGMVLFARLVIPRFYRHWDRFMEKRTRLSATVSDVLNGVRVVKAFGREHEEGKRFEKQSADFRDASITAETAMAKVFPVFRVIAMLGTPIVWLVGGWMVFRGSMTLGDIIAFSMYLGMLYGPVFVLTRLAQNIPASLTAASRVFEVMETEPELAEAPDAVSLTSADGRIELRHVSFGYEAHKPVLNDVSLTVEPGEMIGLVGHSGAGKSTVINIMCRLYDPQSGAVFVDGVDVKKIRQSDLRRQIGMVLQETFLLSGSLADNIAYARPEASPLDIIRAARAANAHDFIANKPDGYDTAVTEGGGNLSVGEKQRISIARAVLSDPRILILDEATASVDLETEKQIQEALQRLVNQRTTIAIAHRLTTLKNAHRLVVMNKGGVEDMGTHEELLSRGGTYSRLVHLHQEMAALRGVSA